ncbi:hypothetical protein SASPL_112384 [Salvia splendens]|uniref:Fanconi anemia group I protein n=1 Tax=Salvia splendens TaxID=180675 RepID=A0A8X8YDS4_SALSN|nr:hypothetical protein SASPL_112384 [Salvia splendens]
MREDVEMQDLPGLVYQLVLAAKGFGKREDPSLGLEVLGLVRQDSRAFNHFTVKVLLSVARIRRFSDSAIDILTTALFNAYKDYKFAKVCRWLPDELKEEYLENARVIEKAILKSVNGSHYGREHIVPSIVQLGFGLLHAVEEGAQKDISKSDGLMGTEELDHDTELITFQIIEQCKYHVLSMKPEKCFPITRLLGYLVQVQPHPMLEHISHLKEMLDYFTFMDGRISSNFVTVLLPLMKFSRNLQDYTILVLRKAMFRRENSVRLAACSATFDLLSAEKQSKPVGLFSFQESSSQASCSQQAEEPHATRADLFQELSGLLQRCLYQQANVRENVYHGIMKLVVVDPLTCNRAILNEELQLGIDQCVKLENGKFCIEEPLDCLLFCVSSILLLQPQNRSDHPSESVPCFGFSISQDNEAGRNFSAVSFSNALAQIRKFLKLGLLGKKQDSDSTPIKEEKRKCSATLLLGILEVVMNNIVNELVKAANEQKLELEMELSQFVEIHEFVDKYTSNSRHGSGAKKPVIRPSASDAADKLAIGCAKQSPDRTPLLATSSIHHLLRISLESWELENSKNGAASQRNSQPSSGKAQVLGSKILSRVLHMCFHQLKFFSQTGKDDPFKTLVYGEIKLIGPPLLNIIFSLKSVSKKEAKVQKDVECRKENIHLALLCLKKIIEVSLSSAKYLCLIDHLVSTSLPEENVATCAWCDDECKLAEGIDDQSTKSKELFLKSIKPLLIEFLEFSFFREAEILCDMVLMIGKKLPEERRNLVGSLATQLCRRSDVLNSKVAKSLVFIAVTLTSPPADMVIAENMAAELVQVLGSEDTDPVEESETFPIIKKSTKAPELAVEEVLYSRAEAVVKVLSHFVAKNLKDPQAEHLLKLAAKFYKYLARISKLRISPKGCKQFLPSSKSKTTRSILSSLAKSPNSIRSTSRDFKIVESTEDAPEEQNPNQEEADSHHSTAHSSSESDNKGEGPDDAECGSPLAAGDGADDGERGSPLAADDTENEDEEEAALRQVKRARTSRVVQDSDEEV